MMGFIHILIIIVIDTIALLKMIHRVGRIMIIITVRVEITIIENINDIVVINMVNNVIIISTSERGSSGNGPSSR